MPLPPCGNARRRRCVVKNAGTRIPLVRPTCRGWRGGFDTSACDPHPPGKSCGAVATKHPSCCCNAGKARRRARYLAHRGPMGGFVQDAAAVASGHTGVLRATSSCSRGPGPLGRASYVHGIAGTTLSASCALLDEDSGVFATCASVLEWMALLSVSEYEERAEGSSWRWRRASATAGTSVHVHAPALRSSQWMAAEVVAIAWVPSVAEALACLDAVSWLQLRDASSRHRDGCSLPRGTLVLCRVAEAARSGCNGATTRSAVWLSPTLSSASVPGPPREVRIGAAVVAAASPMALLAPWLLSAGATSGIVSSLVRGGRRGRPPGATHTVVLSDARMAGEAEGGLALVDVGSAPGQPRCAAFVIGAPLCWAQDCADLARMADGLSSGREAGAESATGAASRLLDRMGTRLQPWIQGCGASAALARERPLLPLAGIGSVLRRLFPRHLAPARGEGPQRRTAQPSSQHPPPPAAAATAGVGATVGVLRPGRWGSGVAVAHPRLVLTCAHVLGGGGGGPTPCALLRPGEGASPRVTLECPNGQQATARVLWCGGDGTQAPAATPAAGEKGGQRPHHAALDAALLILDRPACSVSELPRVGEHAPVPGHAASVCGYGLYPPHTRVGPLVTGGTVAKVRCHLLPAAPPSRPQRPTLPA